MRIIRQEFTELQQEISLFSVVFYNKHGLISMFPNRNFCHSQNETSTTINNLIDNFMGYNMMLNYRRKYTAFKISSIPQYRKVIKNSCLVTLLVDPFSQFDQKQSIDN